MTTPSSPTALPEVLGAENIAYIRTIEEQMRSQALFPDFQKGLLDLAHQIDLYKTAKNDALKKNAGIFFERYENDLRRALEKSGVNEAKPIAGKIAQMYRDAADYKAPTTGFGFAKK